MSVAYPEIPADPQKAFDAGVEHGIRTVKDILESEARWQWEQHYRRVIGAQMIAQRLGVLIAILKDRLDSTS